MSASSRCLPLSNPHQARRQRSSVPTPKPGRGLQLALGAWLGLIAAQAVAEPFEIEDMPGDFDGVTHAWTEARRPVAVDFNGDGQPSWYAGGNRVAHPKTPTPLDPLRYGTAALPTISLPICPSCTPRPVAFAVADVNRDGRPDIVRLNEWNGQSFDYTLQVFLANSSNGFTLGYRFDYTDNPSFNEGTHYYQLALADFDRDGDPDLAQLATYENLNGQGSTNVDAGHLRIRWNSNGSFASETILQGLQFTYDSVLLIGDVERDGDVDLTVSYGRIWNSDGIITSIYFRNFLNAGSGTFSSVTQNIPTFPLTLTDANRDGVLDYMMSSGGIAIDRAESQGDGTFNGLATFATGVTGRSPLATAIVDADENGTPDLFTAEGATTSQSRNLVLRRGLDNGSTGQPEILATLPSNILQIGVGDARGDADADLLLRLADGSFRHVRNTAQRLRPGSSGVIGSANQTGLTRLEIADSNRDGRMDLFALDSSGGRLRRVLGGSAAGTFNFAGSEFKILAGSPTDFALGDFSLDGKLDFAYVEPTLGVVRSVTQIDNIYFSWTDTKIADVAGAAILRAGNAVNYNATPDLLVASNNDGSLRWLRNQSAGTVWNPTVVRDSHPVMPDGMAVVPLYGGFGDAAFACDSDDIAFAINGYSNLIGWSRTAQLIQVQDVSQTGVCGTANLDADRELELAFLSGDGRLMWWNPTNTPASPVVVIDAQPSGLLRAIRATDWNRDGLDDLLVATSQGLFLYTQQGLADDWVRTSLYAAGEVRDAVAVDFDRDSRPDAAFITATGYHLINNASLVSETVSSATPGGTPLFLAPGGNGQAFSLEVGNPGRFQEDADIAVVRTKVTFRKASDNGIGGFSPGATMTKAEVQQAVASVTIEMNGLVIGTQGTATVQADGSLEIPYHPVLGNLVPIPAGESRDLIVRVNLTANAGSASYNNFFVQHLFSPDGVRVLHGDEPIGLLDSLALFAQNRIRIGSPQRGTLAFETGEYTVGEGAGTVTLTVRRVGGSDGAVSVQFSTADGSATAGADYAPGIATLSWADGDSSDRTVAITLVNDLVHEPEEVFSASLSNPQGGAALGAAFTTSVTVLDNDLQPPAGELGFSAAGYSVDEAGGNASITLRRANGSFGAVSIQLSTSDGTATAGADYTATTTTVNWADGDSADKTVLVPVSNDSSDEPDESFIVTVSNAAGGASVGAINNATITIVDNDLPPPAGAVQFSASSYSADEADGDATITLRRVSGSAGAISVQFATSNGMATAGSDYAATMTTVNWADGDSADKTVQVPITNDSTDEPDESFTVALSNPGGGASLGMPNNASVMILDNDLPPPAGAVQFSASSYSVDETGGNATITLRRVSGSAGAISVQFATGNGTATAGSDYTATMTTVNWAAGDSADKTVQIPILDDSSDEADETVTLILSNPGGGASVGNPNPATLTVTDDDPTPPGGDQIFSDGFEGI